MQYLYIIIIKILATKTFDASEITVISCGYFIVI